MRLKTVLGAAAICAALAACQETDPPVGPNENGIDVTSDPEGALIILDGTDTRKLTRSVITDFDRTRTLHEVLVRLEKNNIIYGFRTQVDMTGDSTHHVSGPLLSQRCTDLKAKCEGQTYHTLGGSPGTLRVSTNPNGALFYFDGTSQGLQFPANQSNSKGYVVLGMPVVGMLAARDTLSLGIYDVGYMAGRPSPTVVSALDRYTVKQSFWIVPLQSVIAANVPTVRGIEVEEELIGLASTNDVAFIKLTFRNITNTASYQAVDPFVPPNGVRFDSVYFGFAIDPDIGDSHDDILTYDPSLNMVYAYDMDFQETGYDRPALVGLKIIESPAGAARILNGWPATRDWTAGDPASSEAAGWGHIERVEIGVAGYGRAASWTRTEYAE
jgi:hypothetical protein